MTRRNNSGAQSSFDPGVRNMDLTGFNKAVTVHCDCMVQYSKGTQWAVKRRNRAFDEDVGLVPNSKRNKVTLPKFLWDK